MSRKQPTPPPAPIPAESGYYIPPNSIRTRRWSAVLDWVCTPAKLALVVAFIAAIVFGGAYLIEGTEPDGLTLGVWAIAIVLTFRLSSRR